MIKGLKTALKSNPLEKLRADHDAAAQAVADAQAARDSLALDAELAPDDDTGATKRLAAAEKALAAAKERESALAGAIRAAEVRERRKAEKEAADARAAQWDAAEAAAKRRVQFAEAAEKAIADLAEAWAGLDAAQREIFAAAPVRLDSGEIDGACLGFKLISAVKLELVRRGFRWAETWLGDPVTIKPLAEQVAEGNRFVKGLRVKYG